MCAQLEIANDFDLLSSFVGDAGRTQKMGDRTGKSACRKPAFLIQHPTMSNSKHSMSRMFKLKLEMWSECALIPALDHQCTCHHPVQSSGPRPCADLLNIYLGACLFNKFKRVFGESFTNYTKSTTNLKLIHPPQVKETQRDVFFNTNNFQR